MTHERIHLFVPGYGARAVSYERGLPPSFETLQPPPLRRSGGSLEVLVRWLVDEVERRSGQAVIVGHSMGAALAILATPRIPNRIDGLVLLSPAGLPLAKPLRSILADGLRNATRGVPGPPQLAATVLDALLAPAACVRLGGTLRRLDLSGAMDEVRRLGKPIDVVGCATDTLVPPEVCVAVAERLGARYVEIESQWGHVWPLVEHALVEARLSSAEARAC